MKERKRAKKEVYKATANFSKMPLGMIFILVLLFMSFFSMAYSLIGTIFQGSSSPMQFGPALISSNLFIILYYFVILAIEGMLIYGIFKRKRWARTLGIVWFGFSVLLILFNLVFVSTLTDYLLELYGTQMANIPQESAGMVSGFLYKVSVAVLLISGLIDALILRYFIKKEDFFHK
jgi:hypothetical protein